MPTAVWIGLAVLVLAVVAGTAFVAVRALEMWRSFRRLQQAVEGATGSLLDAVSKVEKRAADLQEGAPKVQHSLERLHESMAVLQLELGILQSARAPLMRFRAAAVPRK